MIKSKKLSKQIMKIVKLQLKQIKSYNMKLKKLLWLKGGTYFESKDIKNLSFDIRIDNSLKKKQLFEFEHNTSFIK